MCLNVCSKFSILSALLCTLSCFASPAEAQIAYGTNGSTLFRFDVNSPTSITTVGKISGATTLLDSIDFRLSDGLLYGYSYAGNQVVTVNLATAETTFVSRPTISSVIPINGINFDPVTGDLRLVDVGIQAGFNTSDLRINVDTGATVAGPQLTYAPGDQNFGQRPVIYPIAYTNNDANTTTGTTLYYLDSQLDTLVTTADPNSGLLITVGRVGFDVAGYTGFDIYTNAQGLNTAYAVSDFGTLAGLYRIDLNTGASTLVGRTGVGMYALAIQPTVSAAAPEPDTAVLLATATIPLISLVARRKCRG